MPPFKFSAPSDFSSLGTGLVKNAHFELFSAQIIVWEHFSPPKDEQGRVVLKFSNGMIFQTIENPIEINLL